MRIALGQAALLAGLLLPRHVLADVATRTGAGSVASAELPGAASPPAWMQWLGWSDDGTRLAWREGGPDATAAPGQPAEVARLDEWGAITSRLHLTGRIGWSLARRTIRVRAPAQQSRAAAADVLVRADSGPGFAVVARRVPPELAVLRSIEGKGYQPVARVPVRTPALPLDVAAFPDPTGRLMAIIAHTGAGRLRQATLLVVPLRSATETRPMDGLPAADVPSPVTNGTQP
ncbi:MAG: hypothetical protein EXR79_09340 [Myxococcales bacterium]|nr:hypothetical protein [Myxococcales bacterium]